jgi:hypothetical protein
MYNGSTILLFVTIFVVHKQCLIWDDVDVDVDVDVNKTPPILVKRCYPCSSHIISKYILVSTAWSKEVRFHISQNDIINVLTF